MLSNGEIVLMKVLDCGEADLSILEDINYDLDDIIEDLQNNNILDLNNVFRSVLVKGVQDLNYVLIEKNDEVKQSILKAIHSLIDQVIESNEDLTSLDDNDEFNSLLEDYRLLVRNNLKPFLQYDVYVNYLDTHVFLEYLDFYKKWMKDDLESIEHNMGFDFEDKD